MSLTWRLMDSGVTEAWDVVVTACRHATFFHTKAWTDLFCTTFPMWRADSVAIEYSDGNLMVLPMMRRLPLGYRESMVPWVYGGPLFLRPPDERHWEAVERVPRWFPEITLLDNPFSPYTWEQDGLVRWRNWTQATNLTPGFGTLWKRFREAHRRHFKAAQKIGVTVAPAATLADVDAYYEVYQDSLKRWGSKAEGFYPRRLYRHLLGLPEYGKGARIWLARLNGEVIGGIVMLYHHDQAVYWQGCSHSTYLSSHASPLLLITALEAACQEGFRWFDFMGPSRHLKGVHHFKEGFATELLRFNSYYSHTLVGKMVKRYRSLKERYLRRNSL